jgi:hypothetical protein
MHDETAASRWGSKPFVDTKALIETAKRVSAESYVARFRALNIAVWAFLLCQKSAELRHAAPFTPQFLRSTRPPDDTPL